MPQLTTCICEVRREGGFYYYSARKPAPLVLWCSVEKRNRGGCWTSGGRPPQHRAIVRKGHESSGVPCWFARKCSSISIAASDLANAFSLSRSVLFATKARSLFLFHQWKDHQPILVANIYRGEEDRSAVQKAKCIDWWLGK